MHLDLMNVTRAVDDLLEVTENPRRRRILLNFRRHALLEVSGRWTEILVPSMTVAHPVYRIDDAGTALVFDGMPEVSGFYRTVAEAGLTVFGPLEETAMVSDTCYAAESTFAQIMPAQLARTMPNCAGAGDIPADLPADAHYLFVHDIAMFWPYTEDGLLIGEHIYEASSSRRVEPLAAGYVITPAQAATILAPLLTQQPAI